MSKFTDYFPTSGGGGGGGGSILPTIVDITTPGPSLWSVPSAIQTAITDNGSFPYEALLVGGGGGSQGGEVTYQSRTFTSADYYDAGQNTIIMNVGTGTGDTNATTAIAPQMGSAVNTMTTINSPGGVGKTTPGSYNWVTGGSNNFPDSPIGAFSYEKASNGNPFISRIRITLSTGAQIYNNNYASGIPTTQPIYMETATGAYATLQINSTSLSWAPSGDGWGVDGGIYIYLNRTGLDLTDETAPTYQTSIGGNDATRKSISNRDSIEGYYGGYGSANASGGFTNSGQRSQAGLIKLIYY